MRESSQKLQKAVQGTPMKKNRKKVNTILKKLNITPSNLKAEK